jgi:UDP-glucose 4-epimerase
VCAEVAAGKRPFVEIFGTDYDTFDGTAVRDFIHLSDLANAHVLALNYLQKGGKSEVLNCGYGHGYSVKEVLQKVKEVTGKDIKIEYASRRPGDPASLTARVDRIHSVIGWEPQYDSLDFIIKSAYEWEKKRPY